MCLACREPLAYRIASVTLCVRRLGRVVCAIVGSLSVTGCAIFEVQTSGATLGQQGPRVSLKDDGRTAPVVASARFKAAEKARGTEQVASVPVARAAPAVEPGACGNADQCALLLRLMVDDPTRSWIAQRPAPVVYANGTRLFAYLALRGKLSCRELTLGLDETQTLASSLSGGIRGLTLDQVTRVRALNSQVEGELRADHSERCKHDPATPSG
jgi:hypothetical protein